MDCTFASFLRVIRRHYLNPIGADLSIGTLLNPFRSVCRADVVQKLYELSQNRVGFVGFVPMHKGELRALFDYHFSPNMCMNCRG